MKLNSYFGLLLCVPLVLPAAIRTPAQLNALHVGTNLVLTFTGRLQISTQVAGVYTDVVGARNPHVAAVTSAPHKFWRVALDGSQGVAAGDMHSVALRSDGSLWTWGNNSVGQLGDGTWDDSDQPVRVGSNTNWCAVFASSFHTVALRNDGTLWTWGGNSYGQLGIGTTAHTNRPVQIGTDMHWRTAAAGHGHTLAVHEDGRMWAWGWNGAGQLGASGVIDRTNEPVLVDPSAHWKALGAAMNGTHSLGVGEDGTLWSWGGNSSGQLGTQSLSVSTNRPALVEAYFNWQAVAAGGDHSVGLCTDGTLWTWGSNESGQLGNSTFGGKTNQPAPVETNSTWRTIAAGAFNVAAIRTDGTLWTWGLNGRGQLGTATANGTNRPTQVGTNANWEAVACGYTHMVALRGDGTLWTWGTLPNQVTQATNWIPRQIPGVNWGLPR